MSMLPSMVKETSENCTDLSADDSGTIEEVPEDTILSRQASVNLIPSIGQRFVSQDAAYEFYCSFAKQCGFSIRRHRTRGKDGVGRGVTRRDFTCHRGGYPQIKPYDDGKMQRNRKSSRCGCQAYMRIVKRTDFDVTEWRITGFSNVHNHELMESNEVLLFPAYCPMSADDKSRICLFVKAGMSVRQMLRLMELEKDVKLGGLPFTEIDIRNLLQSFRNVDRDTDAIDLLMMCKNKKDKDPNFRYNFKMDTQNRLEHIAWTYASSVQSYEAFGDAIIFDTTHRLDAYDMLLGIWVGVDCHGMTCFFGCVLLRDENQHSFSWALKTFLTFMNGKAPVTVLTDQNMWLKDAIAVEMPRTKHAFCIWHIISKFSDWFSVLLGPLYDKWKADFHRLYNLDLVEDFELGWQDMITTYGLHGNKHMVSLYAFRTFWALPFLRNHFFAGMTVSVQAESVNAYIQQFLSAQTLAEIFVEKLGSIIDHTEAKQKMQKRTHKVSLKAGSPLESQASAILTPHAFGKLQEELLLAPQYASLIVDENYFVVRHHTEIDGGHKVVWIPQDEFISCSCRWFEFSGILCRHVLRVLSASNCFNIPDRYLPLRWRSTTSSFTKPKEPVGKLQLLQSMIETLVAESLKTEERLVAACDLIAIMSSRIKEFPGSVEAANGVACNSCSNSSTLVGVEDSGESGTLGTVKERKSRDGMGVFKKHRHCSVPCCGQFGHGAADCPLMGGADLKGDGLGFL